MKCTAKEILRDKAKMDSTTARTRMPNNPILDYAAKLTEFLMYDAICPCCGEAEYHWDDCTFITDCPESYERMKAIREILFK